MSDRTAIEWSDATWNPVTGCTKVSRGCKNCYAERVFPRAYGSRKFADIKLHHDRLEQPLHWRKPRHIFVNSMSDLFHEDVTDNFIDAVWTTMAKTPWHTYQILTKRPQRMFEYISRNIANGRTWREGITRIPLPNVWLGVSCEDQETADERIPLLLRTPAAVRFISCEPLLKYIDLRSHFLGHCREHDYAGGFCLQRDHTGIEHLHWVIVGGESGPNARNCDLSWVLKIVKDCKTAEVPCFVKQLGAWPTIDHTRVGLLTEKMRSGAYVRHSHWTLRLSDRAGANPSEWPEDLRVREFPKNEAQLSPGSGAATLQGGKNCGRTESVA